jgi:hypothetical protein
MVQFEVAGKRNDDDIIFLTYSHRVYKTQSTVFHRNDYHTVLRMNDVVFKKNFRYNRLSGVYKNLTNITWGEIKKIADVNIYQLS